MQFTIFFIAIQAVLLCISYSQAHFFSHMEPGVSPERAKFNARLGSLIDTLNSANVYPISITVFHASETLQFTVTCEREYYTPNKNLFKKIIKDIDDDRESYIFTPSLPSFDLTMSDSYYDDCLLYMLHDKGIAIKPVYDPLIKRLDMVQSSAIPKRFSHARYHINKKHFQKVNFVLQAFRQINSTYIKNLIRKEPLIINQVMTMYTSYSFYGNILIQILIDQNAFMHAFSMEIENHVVSFWRCL